MAMNCASWRKQIIKAIEERDKAQCEPYIQQLIKSCMFKFYSFICFDIEILYISACVLVQTIE